MSGNSTLTGLIAEQWIVRLLTRDQRARVRAGGGMESFDLIVDIIDRSRSLGEFGIVVKGLGSSAKARQLDGRLWELDRSKTRDMVNRLEGMNSQIPACAMVVLVNKHQTFYRWAHQNTPRQLGPGRFLELPTNIARFLDEAMNIVG
jgi:hypothetical protein